ncbi:hypothetical protein PS1_036232 [Malus domestica]
MHVAVGSETNRNREFGAHRVPFEKEVIQGSTLDQPALHTLSYDEAIRPDRQIPTNEKLKGDVISDNTRIDIGGAPDNTGGDGIPFHCHDCRY